MKVPRGTSRLFVLAAGLFFITVPAFAQSSATRAYSFPFLGVSDGEQQSLELGFSLQWALFSGLSGNAGTAMYYLALAAAFVGAMLMVFNKKNHNLMTAITWFLMVVIMLFAPYNSRLLFYPIKPESTTVCEPVNLSSNGGGASGGISNKACGFTPQMVALHFGSVLNVLFYDLLNSAGIQNAVQCASDRFKISRSQFTQADRDAITPMISKYQAQCPDSGPPLPKRLQTGGVADTSQTQKSYTFSSMVNEIRQGYAGSGSEPKPVIGLVKNPQDAGWAFNTQSSEWLKYMLGVEKMYHFFGGNGTVTDQGSKRDASNLPAGATSVDLDQAIDYIATQTTTPGSPYRSMGPDGISFFLGTVPAGGNVQEQESVTSRSLFAMCDNPTVYNRRGDSAISGMCNAGYNDVGEALVQNRDRFFALANDADVKDMPVAYISTARDCPTKDNASTGQVCNVTASLIQNCADLGESVFRNVCAANLGAAGRTGSASSIQICNDLVQGNDVCANAAPSTNQELRNLCGMLQGCDGGGFDTIAFTMGEGATLTAANNPLTDAEREAVGGATPKTLGAWGTNMGWLASFMAGVGVQVASWFSGATAMAFIYIMRNLINLAFVMIPVITPLFFVMGLLIPGNAMGLFFLSVVSLLILKMVSVTWLVIDFIASTVYQSLPTTDGGSQEQALLLLGVAGLYLSSIGLTLFMMFKIGDPGNVAALARLDGAAKEAAEAGNRMANAALAIAAAGAASLVGGAASGVIGASRAAALKKAGDDALGRAANNAGLGGAANVIRGNPGGSQGAVQEGEPDGKGPQPGGANPQMDIAKQVNQSTGGQFGEEAILGAMNGPLDENGMATVVNSDTGEQYKFNPLDGSATAPLAGGAVVAGTSAATGPITANNVTAGTATGGAAVVTGTGPASGGDTPPAQPAPAGDPNAPASGGGGAAATPDAQAAVRTQTTAEGSFTDAQNLNAGKIKDMGFTDERQFTDSRKVDQQGNVTYTAPDGRIYQLNKDDGSLRLGMQNADGTYRAPRAGSKEDASFNEVEGLSAQIFKQNAERDKKNAVQEAEKKQGAGGHMDDTNKWRRGAVGAWSGFVGFLSANQGTLTSLPIVGNAIKEVLNETRQADMRAAGWAARGDGSYLRGAMQRRRDRRDAESGSFWAQEVKEMSAADSYRAMIGENPDGTRSANSMQGQVNIARQAANNAAATTRSQFEVMAAKQEEIQMQDYIDRHFAAKKAEFGQRYKGMSQQDAAKAAQADYDAYVKAYEEIPANRRAVESEAQAHVTANFKLSNAVFSRAQLDGVGTLQASQAVHALQADAAMMQPGATLKRGGQTFDVGVRTIGLLAGAQANKSLSGTYDQMLLNQYKVQEKQIRGATSALNPGGSKAQIQRYIQDDMSDDYQVMAIREIVEKKEAFREWEGIAKAYREGKAQEVIVKPQITAKFRADALAANKGMPLTEAQEAALDDKIKMALPLERIHPTASYRGYKKTLSRMRSAGWERSYVDDDIRDKEWKMQEKALTAGVDNLPEHLMRGASRRNSRTGATITLGNLPNELVNFAYTAFGKDGARVLSEINALAKVQKDKSRIFKQVADDNTLTVGWAINKDFAQQVAQNLGGDVARAMQTVIANGGVFVRGSAGAPPAGKNSEKRKDAELNNVNHNPNEVGEVLLTLPPKS